MYDGDGNRVSKTVAGVTTTYLVSDLNPTGYVQVLGETISAPGTSTDTRSFTYGLDRISQWRYAAAASNYAYVTSYYVYDGHGSVRALADSSGNVTDTYDYDAFGNLIHSTTTLSSPTPNEFLFAGEQYDSDLHLYYNRARYLNVSTGRFWSMDTFEGLGTDPFSLHRYLYASADPSDRVDPSGQQDFVSELAAEDIGEEVDGSEAEADFTAKKALNAKIVDIYSCSKLQAYIIPIHCWVYANEPGGVGFRYDFSAAQGERGPGLIFGTVSSVLEITPTTLADVQADANLSFDKQASLSELGYVQWNAAVVAEFEFVSYSFNDLISNALNCITFTGVAIAMAKGIEASEQ